MKSLAYHKSVAVVFLIVSLLCSFYWIGAYLIGDVYRWILIGVIYEMLWLPALAAIYLFPAFFIILALWNRFKIHKYYYFGFSVMIVTNALLYFYLIPKYF